MKIPRVLLVGAVAALCVSVSRADAVLVVDSVSGTASAERLGSHIELKPGDALAERDVIRVGDDSRLSLHFARHGFLDIGPATEVGLEKLPYAPYATDLKSIFSLSRGYLRVVWKHLSVSNAWPLYVYFGGQRASLGTGEFFFDVRSGQARACVAGGQLSVVPAPEPLRAGACYRLANGLAPEVLPRDPDTWIAVRRGFSLDAPTSAEAALAASEPAEAPAAPPRLTPGPLMEPYTSPVTIVVDPGGLPRLPRAPQNRPAPPSAAPGPEHGSLAVVASASMSEMAKPAAAPLGDTAKAPAPEGGAWALNVASYPEAADAETHAQRLRAAGYSTAAAMPASVNGKTWYRVQLQGYASGEAARAAGESLKSKLGLKTVWVVRQS